VVEEDVEENALFFQPLLLLGSLDPTRLGKLAQFEQSLG
jgi:hypothetical protein